MQYSKQDYRLGIETRVNSFLFLFLLLRKDYQVPSSMNCVTPTHIHLIYSKCIFIYARASNTFNLCFFFHMLRINQRWKLCNSISDSDIISLGRLNTKISHYMCFIPFLLFSISLCISTHRKRNRNLLWSRLDDR